MARPIGREVVEHWKVTPGGFNQPAQETHHMTYRGCWVDTAVGEEGEGNHRNLLQQAEQIMVPVSVTLQDAHDFFIWQRHPEDKYRAAGRVGRLYDRRGKHRLDTIPVEVRE